MTPTESLAELSRRRALAHGLGGPDRIRRQHERGLLTARERVELLLDPGSQFEFGSLVHSDEPGAADRTYGDGRLVGFGRIEGRRVAYSAGDSTIKGGSGGSGSRRRDAAFNRIVKASAIPNFGLIQGGGARITEILTSAFAGYYGGSIGRRAAFPKRETHFLAALGNYYAPWSVPDADFSIMTEKSNISISSPAVVEEATGQIVTPEQLGGPDVHAKITGQIDAIVPDDGAAILLLRRVFGYYPANAFEQAPVLRTGDPVGRVAPELRSLVPDQPNRAFDVKKAITAVVDRDSFIEFAPSYGANMVIGIARMDGHTVGIAANQPRVRAGALDLPAIHKLKRILVNCEANGFPLVTFLDVPGVLPTLEQEHRRLLTEVFDYAVARIRAPIPKISVFLRKAYGYALFGMSGADHEWYSLAWPSAQIAFMGPEPGVRVSYRREMDASPDPQAYLRQRADEFRAFAEPWAGAELAYIDQVIDPAATRPALIRALEIARLRLPTHRSTLPPEAAYAN
ncbi:MAG: acyl-CoA carboxylase subunit beta [Dehalococcoidia bacterium]